MPRSAEPAPLAVSPLGSELLDDPAADASAARESLRNIALANRWFGGARAVRRGLVRLLIGIPRGTRLTLLDLGTGMGDIPLAAARWAARAGVHLVPLGIERSGVAARLARSAGLPVAVADIGRLPFRPRCADVVLASQVAHHFSPQSAGRLFRLCGDLARHGVIVADLHRSAGASASFAIGARLLRFDPITRADGHTSIRRGYSVAELRALLAQAGVRTSVRRVAPWRLVAAWRVGP